MQTVYLHGLKGTELPGLSACSVNRCLMKLMIFIPNVTNLHSQNPSVAANEKDLYESTKWGLYSNYNSRYACDKINFDK